MEVEVSVYSKKSLISSLFCCRVKFSIVLTYALLFQQSYKSVWKWWTIQSSWESQRPRGSFWQLHCGPWEEGKYFYTCALFACAGAHLYTYRWSVNVNLFLYYIDMKLPDGDIRHRGDIVYISFFLDKKSFVILYLLYMAYK